MIDIISIIQEQLKIHCYRISYDQLIQIIRNGIFKGDSERYINHILYERYLQLRTPTPFPQWREARFQNAKMGYGFVIEIEQEIRNYIGSTITNSIENMSDVKLIATFKEGLIIQSIYYNPAYSIHNCIDFRYLYPTVYINSEYEKKIRVKENNVNFGTSQT